MPRLPFLGLYCGTEHGEADGFGNTTWVALMLWYETKRAVVVWVVFGLSTPFWVRLAVGQGCGQPALPKQREGGKQDKGNRKDNWNLVAFFRVILTCRKGEKEGRRKALKRERRKN